MKPLYRLVVCFLFLSYASIGQEVEFKGGVEVMGILSSEEGNPFWLYSNTNNQVGNGSAIATSIDGNAQYSLSNSSTLEAGLSVFYRDGVSDEVQRNNLYLQFKNTWLKATLGSKAQTEWANGLSTTNQNFLWSSNARAIPGLLIEANTPIQLTKSIGVDWGIGHYQLNDDRYVEDVRLHYKRLGAIFSFSGKSKLTARIQHFAQWAGTSPDFGELPNDFKAFGKVFLAQKGEETFQEGEVTNAVGNHLGSYFLQYEFDTTVGDFAVYHEHPFEDGSGTAFKNIPDGVWGVLLNPENSRFVKSILLEYVTTKDQSGADTGRDSDNYFNNTVYRSGWTYEGNIIGFPFILANAQESVSPVSSVILSSRVSAIHLGVSGAIRELEWKLKSTYAQQFGTFQDRIEPAISTWHNYLELNYPTQVYGTFTFIGGADVSDTNSVVAAALKYRYSF